MARLPRFLAAAFLTLTAVTSADHVILTGGPTLRRWENLRTPEDQHDRWWANFVRASTLRMAEIRTAYGKDAPLVWIVYQPAYAARGREDGKPYTTWLTELAAARRATLIWVNSGGDVIRAINNRPSGSIQTFDYFGHSNRYCFMFDYGNEVMAASTSWLHQNDLGRLRSSVFAKNAYCKSWGCHTAESMSDKWKAATGTALEGARGATNYDQVGQGTLPVASGGWIR
ncbi:hypothetical protein KBB96_05420 [Luteolibacter ambystomatis]|uniref:DUF4038 domain-containing protein n=1 Tax=Luteolibacter ambystomatis TaxID=2824561 RepID=A0A975PFZ2_9BACT|nr:hypothetical protein [Luteolibacter ambystomatis]QUE52329.1 hypothetical protein KBB96_05420 [Luteolibacter ambystomatis]